MVDVTASQMFPRYKPYPAYKASGAEWLGEIPGHWEVSATKRVGRVVNGSRMLKGVLAGSTE